jgi:hypothetical protein
MSENQPALLKTPLGDWHFSPCVLRFVVGVAVALLGPFTSACRDTEPPRVLNVDLGDADLPLPPPATSARMNPAILGGRAEWRDFREPQLARMTGEPGAAPGVADAARPVAPASQDDAQIKRIRATLDEFNALVAEGKRDELPDYLVASQVDTMESLTKRQAEFMQKMGEVRRAFEAKLPDQGERIAKVFKFFDDMNKAPLIVDEIRMEGAGRASGVVQNIPGGLQVEFELEEDVWYIKFPDTLLGQSLAMIEGALPMFEQLKNTLESDDALAEQMLAALEQSQQAMMNAIGAAPTEGG